MRTSLLMGILLLVVVGMTHQIYSENSFEKLDGPYGDFINNIAGDENLIYSVSHAGILRQSTDLGLNWTETTFTGTFERVFFHNNLYYFVLDNTLYIYDKDNDPSPRIFNQGAENIVFAELYFDANNKIWAATDQGIYVKEVDSQNWELLYDFPEYVSGGYLFDVLPVDNNTIFAASYEGLFVSRDGGETWEDKNSELDLEGSFKSVELIRQLSDNSLITSTLTSTFRSTDNGETWMELVTLEDRDNINDILEVNEEIFVARGLGRGLFRSTDNCQTWQKIINEYISDIWSKDNAIFLSTLSGILCYNIQTEELSERNTGISELNITSILFDNNKMLVGDNNGAIHISIDNASTWSKAIDLDFGINCLVSSQDGTLYAGTQWGGVFKSEDHAETWAEINTDLDDPDIKDIEISGAGGIFAGTFTTLYTSVNDGDSWTDIFPQRPEAIESYDLQKLGNKVYISCKLYGVLLANESTGTMTQINAGLANDRVTSFAASSTDIFATSALGNQYEFIDDEWVFICKKNFDMIIYKEEIGLIGVGNDAALYSTDKGVSWIEIAQIPDANFYINRIEVDKDNRLLLATSSGIYRTVDPIRNEMTVIPTTDFNFEIFPNPVSDQLYIKSKDVNAFSGEVFDLNGKLLLAFKNEPKLDVTDLENGTYFLRLKHADAEELHKIIIAK